MEEAFYDERYAPFVGRRVWFALCPLLLAEVVGLMWYHHHARNSCAHDTAAAGHTGDNSRRRPTEMI